jgi:hypothetical protein
MGAPDDLEFRFMNARVRSSVTGSRVPVVTRALAVAIVLAVGLTGCSVLDGGTSGSLADAVDESTETGAPFRLSSVTDFEWDRAHVVPPYASERAVTRELGFHWDDADDAPPQTDAKYLIVFVNRGEVVEAFEHDVEGGDLVCLASSVLRRGLTPERDLLATRRVHLSPSDAYDVVFPARPRGDREEAALERCLRHHS